MTTPLPPTSASGANGTATLSGGSVTVTNTKLSVGNRIVFAAITPGGTPGALFLSSKTPGQGFTISSTSASDTSTIEWIIL